MRGEHEVFKENEEESSVIRKCNKTVHSLVISHIIFQILDLFGSVFIRIVIEKNAQFSDRIRIRIFCDRKRDRI